MTWTKTKPELPGWYWCRKPLNGNRASPECQQGNWFVFVGLVQPNGWKNEGPLVLSSIWSYGGSLDWYEFSERLEMPTEVPHAGT